VKDVARFFSPLFVVLAGVSVVCYAVALIVGVFWTPGDADSFATVKANLRGSAAFDAAVAYLCERMSR
jgi:hypothetical protein